MGPRRRKGGSQQIVAGEIYSWGEGAGIEELSLREVLKLLSMKKCLLLQGREDEMFLG